MKPSYFVVVIFLTAVFGSSSCSKEELTTQGGGNITNQTFSPYTLDLTAANWSQVAILLAWLLISFIVALKIFRWQ